MDPRQPYPQQSQNPSVPRRDRGRFSIDTSQRIRLPVSNRDQGDSSMNRAVRQRENDGRTPQNLQPLILGAMCREGDTAARSHNAHNPGYDEPRSVPQQTQSPAGLRREWMAPPPNLDTGRERDEWRYGPLYNPVPPTPQKERIADAQGLNNRHRETLQSLPQRQGNVHMPANGGDSPHAQTIHVPFSKAPCDLTRFIEKIRDQAVGRGGFADVWKCTLSKEDINEERELVAVKCIRLLGCDQSPQEIDKFINRLRGEVHLWVRLDPHEHVLPLYGTANGFGPLPALVSPWAENGTLTNYVGSDRPLSHGRKLKIILQVVSGLQHLHFGNICHGDLTGSNILIDMNGDALISDFGLSSFVAEFSHANYFKSCTVGAGRWTDSQIFIDAVEKTDGSLALPRADFENDIYSIGCITLQACLGMY
ncbi:kinase-like domain-containing protein [Pisolithus marmoratus]|nr:kinase-like domain-containing protein [Pisolithus marmoratus]